MSDFPHHWEITEKYGYATFYKCGHCGKGKMYSWTPGWPGSTEYFTSGGNGQTTVEPPCTANPVGGLFPDE